MFRLKRMIPPSSPCRTAASSSAGGSWARNPPTSTWPASPLSDCGRVPMLLHVEVGRGRCRPLPRMESFFDIDNPSPDVKNASEAHKAASRGAPEPVIHPTAIPVENIDPDAIKVIRRLVRHG